MKQQVKWPAKDKEFHIFLVFFVGMAVYYGYRMFAITPWYDELYTYYYFISRGPVYAAIHWPLPNNHVGYSALSACLNIFGSAAVSLRGVSWLCSLGSLLLLYRIGRKCFAGFPALLPAFVFAGMSMVNQLAVQGRGYALVTFCYLTALWELIHIVVEHRQKRSDYLFFGVSLVAALWAIPSSLYVVMPICVIGGAVLLRQREYKILLHLIITSLASAVCTAGLYGILWLAIGSNLLVKTPDSGFTGMGHGTVILHAPFKAVITGVSYMLDTPYIQSMSREQFASQAADWLQTLFGTQLAPAIGIRGKGMCLLVCLSLAAVMVRTVWRIKGKYHSLLSAGNVGGGNGKRFLLQGQGTADTGCPEEEQDSYQEFLEWYFLLTIFLLSIALIIQCKLPYQRVFSFLGVWAALLVTWLIQRIADVIEKRCVNREKGRGIAGWTAVVCIVLAGGFCILTLLSDTAPYSRRDELLCDAYGQLDMSQAGRVAVTDCDQEYYLLYAYGIGEDRVTRQIEEADIVLLDKALLNREYGYREAPEEWKFYLTKEEIPTAYLEEKMEPVYENWQFILYTRRSSPGSV